MQKSYRAYDHPAPNPQQSHAHLCTPTTSHRNKPQPACSSNARQGSPSSQTPGTATNPQLRNTLPHWMHSPAMPLSAATTKLQLWRLFLELLPQHLFILEENSPLIPLAPHIISIPSHLLPALAQLPLRPWTPGSPAPNTSGQIRPSLTNVTQPSAARVYARRKHCHHHFWEMVLYLGCHSKTEGRSSSKIKGNG